MQESGNELGIFDEYSRDNNLMKVHMKIFLIIYVMQSGKQMLNQKVTNDIGLSLLREPLIVD
jgi:hypothetical protein